MTPIQSKLQEMEKEYQELGFTLNITSEELRQQIRNYTEEKGMLIEMRRR
jgi:hypothetical protein